MRGLSKLRKALSISILISMFCTSTLAYADEISDITSIVTDMEENSTLASSSDVDEIDETDAITDEITDDLEKESDDDLKDIVEDTSESLEESSSIEQDTSVDLGTPEIEPSITSENDESSELDSIPKTSDSSKVQVYALLYFMSLFSLIVLVQRKRK